MIKGKLYVLLSVLVLTSYAQEPKMLSMIPINDGEQLEFKLSWGWFTVGRAKWTTEVTDYRGDQCLKTRVTARSTGMAGVFGRVEDEWGEYIRMNDWMPKMAWRDLLEGSYTLDEKTYFDYNNSKITYQWTKRGNPKPTKYLEMDKDRVGMLGGFMKMRSVDYSKHKPGDVISMEAFFEGEPYNLQVVYEGVETIKSKVGRLKAHILIPRLPENRLFPGEDPIKVWISADKNQLPLRADAKMYIGSFYVELTEYKNVKYGPDYN